MVPSGSAWAQIARTLVDAFDVDLQIFTMRFLSDLRQTEPGKGFVAWAEANPAEFETLIRASSAVLRRVPKNDSSASQREIASLLDRLPFAVRQTVVGDKTLADNLKGSMTGSTQGPQEFKKSYEEAVGHLTEKELVRVARLSSRRLNEWVSSPERLRPHLLNKWDDEDRPTQADIRFQEAYDAVRDDFLDNLKKLSAPKQPKPKPNTLGGKIKDLFGF